jgi:proteasome lid subunit RPN8/RPN11
MHRRPPEPCAAPQPIPVSRPRLLLRPLAFLKLTYLCHAAGTEVGGFGLSSGAEPLVIEDILLVRQQATAVTVEFDDEAVADLIDDQADRGVPPQRCARVWVHTHPGSSASPSGVDERTFARCFGGADFSVMLILARGGETYARLQLIGPVKTAVEIPVVVDWASLPLWLDQQRTTLADLVLRWSMELDELVTQPHPTAFLDFGSGLLRAADAGRDDLADRVELDELAFYEEAADERHLYY